jgi:hypothetical protein
LSRVVRGPLLAKALAVSVCSALSEPTYVPLVLAGPRTLSPVDQEHLRLASHLVQLNLERIGIPIDKTRESHSVLLDRHPTPNLIPPRLPARLRPIHGSQSTRELVTSCLQIMLILSTYPSGAIPEPESPPEAMVQQGVDPGLLHVGPCPLGRLFHFVGSMTRSRWRPLTPAMYCGTFGFQRKSGKSMEASALNVSGPDGLRRSVLF